MTFVQLTKMVRKISVVMFIVSMILLYMKLESLGELNTFSDILIVGFFLMLMTIGSSSVSWYFVHNSMKENDAISFLIVGITTIILYLFGIKVVSLSFGLLGISSFVFMIFYFSFRIENVENKEFVILKQ